MANIPAANVKQVHRGLESNVWHLIYQITGDATGVTFKCALNHVLGHAVGNSTETAGYNPQVSYTNAMGGATITYGAAPSSNAVHYLSLWGN